MTEADPIARFSDKYRGIQGFYFLNNKAELGYINVGDFKLTKETFPQRKDSQFLTNNPGFLKELKGFLRDLGLLLDVYRNNADPTIELGYVLPAHDDSRTWESATLRLHAEVVTTIESDLRRRCENGIKDPFQINSDAQTVQRETSVQRGLDDLITHRDAFGIHRYFPALFHKPANDTAEPAASTPSHRETLRVINLMWRPSDPQTESKTRRRETVFQTLRENLIQHKAIDREQRLENKLTVS